MSGVWLRLVAAVGTHGESQVQSKEGVQPCAAVCVGVADANAAVSLLWGCHAAVVGPVWLAVAVGVHGESQVQSKEGVQPGAAVCVGLADAIAAVSLLWGCHAAVVGPVWPAVAVGTYGEGTVQPAGLKPGAAVCISRCERMVNSKFNP
jgi:hypothetical protein